MCIPWRNTKTSKNPALTYPAAGEFHLIAGDFRDWGTISTKANYYGLCACSYDALCPPGKLSRQDQFYRLVFRVVHNFLSSFPSAILIKDFSRPAIREAHRKFIVQLTSAYAGNHFEEHGETLDSYALLFSKTPVSFLEEIYWYAAKESCESDIHFQYCALREVPATSAAADEFTKESLLNIMIDEVHPVLLLQLASDFPFRKIKSALTNACLSERMTLSAALDEQFPHHHPDKE